MVGRKLTDYFELIKPLVDFKYEVRMRLNIIWGIFYKQIQMTEVKEDIKHKTIMFCLNIDNITAIMMFNPNPS